MGSSAKKPAMEKVAQNVFAMPFADHKMAEFQKDISLIYPVHYNTNIHIFKAPCVDFPRALFCIAPVTMSLVCSALYFTSSATAVSVGECLKINAGTLRWLLLAAPAFLFLSLHCHAPHTGNKKQSGCDPKHDSTCILFAQAIYGCAHAFLRTGKLSQEKHVKRIQNRGELGGPNLACPPCRIGKSVESLRVKRRSAVWI